MNINEQLPASRQAEILEIIKREKSVSVAGLSERLFINQATIRRDLNTLQKTGLISRTYGGAVLTQGLDSDIPFLVRKGVHSEEKKTIAKLASTLIEDGDTIFLDSSSSTEFMIPFIKDRKNLKIVTNGVKLATLLCSLSDCSIYSTGGKLREQSLSYVGNIALENLRSFNFNKAFFSCRGVCIENGLTDGNEEEAILRKLIIKKSAQSFLLADSSKFDTVSFCFIATVHDISAIITENPPEKRWIESDVNIIYNDK